MAEAAKRVTILNQREGTIVLPPDAEDLKKDPKTPHRKLMAGQAIEVSAADAAKFLNYKGLMDASKLVGKADSAEVKRLKADLAAAKAENAKLKEDADKGDDKGKKKDKDA